MDEDQSYIANGISWPWSLGSGFLQAFIGSSLLKINHGTSNPIAEIKKRQSVTKISFSYK